MKHLLILLFPFLLFSQKQTNIGVILDPYSSIKDKGLNIGVEIDYTEDAIYVHTGVQNFAVIEGGWTNWVTGFGFNLYGGIFDQVRFYSGVRGGFIFRGGYTYPTAGIEGGVDYWISQSISLGLRASYDRRSDFIFWGGQPEYRPSGMIKLGFKL